MLGQSGGPSQAGFACLFMKQASPSCCAALVPSGLGGQLQRVTPNCHGPALAAALRASAKCTLDRSHALGKQQASRALIPCYLLAAGPCKYEIHEENADFERVKSEYDRLDEREKVRYASAEGALQPAV